MKLNKLKKLVINGSEKNMTPIYDHLKEAVVVHQQASAKFHYAGRFRELGEKVSYGFDDNPYITDTEIDQLEADGYTVDVDGLVVVVDGWSS